jgi:hypothetical protein
MTTPNITCEAITVHVPDEIAPLDSVAIVRAGIFAQLALWVGTPAVEACERVEGGYRVTIREASAATAKAKRGHG